MPTLGPAPRMRMMGDVVDMVLAVGEEDEAAWLRSLNFCGLLYILTPRAWVRGVHLTPWNQKKRLESQCNNGFEITSSNSGDQKPTRRNSWFEITFQERRQGKLQGSPGILRTWKTTPPPAQGSTSKALSHLPQDLRRVSVAKPLRVRDPLDDFAAYR